MKRPNSEKVIPSIEWFESTKNIQEPIAKAKEFQWMLEDVVKLCRSLDNYIDFINTQKAKK